MGANDGSQFTEEEFQFLARSFDYVLLTKFHGGWDTQLHHEATKRLKELNPALRVFPYMSMKYWFKQNQWGGRPFDPAWYLRDNEGNIVYRSRRKDDPEKVPYVDLANSEYREWTLETLRSWLQSAPYDGITFDAAERIGESEEERIDWEKLLGRDRVEAYNAGIRTLLVSAKRLVGPDREVIYNGIAPNLLRGSGRNLELLDVADGALDERFCLDARGEVNALQDDLELMSRYDDRKLFLHTNYPGDELGQDTRERYGRFCLGSFLLGWRPGLTYFRFGDDYSVDQLRRDIPDMNIPVGPPAGPYKRDGEVLSRVFANGEVYVNIADQPAQVTLARALVKVQAQKELAQTEVGDTITVPPRDAVFLLEPAFLATPERTP